jgi:hypothetical protein
MKSSSSKNEKFSDKKFRVKEKALKITVKKNENFEIEDHNGISDNINKENHSQEIFKNGYSNIKDSKSK